jgi:GntR family transcriptional regulator
MPVHESAVPLYKTLIESLKRAMASGDFQPGERLPSEVDLCATYMVSRITVRNAIAVLADEGYVVKKQGKGTFVEKPKLEREIVGPISFSAACTYKGMRPGSRLIQRMAREASAVEKKELGLGEGERVLFIQRLRFADDEPLLIESNVFPHEAYSFLLDRDVDSTSLYGTIERERGIRIASAHKTIEIAQASKIEADLLTVRIGSPLFYMRGTVFDEEGRPVHLTAQYIRGDRFKLTV